MNFWAPIDYILKIDGIRNLIDRIFGLEKPKTIDQKTNTGNNFAQVVNEQHNHFYITIVSGAVESTKTQLSDKEINKEIL